MTKVFEALRNAQQSLKVAVHSNKPPADLSFKGERGLTKTEDEMIDLYSAIEFTATDQKMKTVQFIGSRPGDGTTTVACEFASTIAHRMNRVLLLLSSEPNAGDYLSSSLKGNILCLNDLIDTLTLNDSGSASSYGNELYISILSGRGIKDDPRLQWQNAGDYFWSTLKNSFDMVLIDSPPASVSPDGLYMASKVDATLLVIRAEETPWRLALRTKERLEKHGANLLGVIFNDKRVYLPQWLSRRLQL